MNAYTASISAMTTLPNGRGTTVVTVMHKGKRYRIDVQIVDEETQP